MPDTARPDLARPALTYARCCPSAWSLVAGPFIWMLLVLVQDRRASCARFRPPGGRRRPPWTTTPAVRRLDFPRYFLNSVIVAGAVTVGNLLFCSMLGYALAKLNFPGKQHGLRAGAGHPDGPRRRDVRAAVRAGERTSGWPTRYPALILPFLAGPFGVFLMRQFISGCRTSCSRPARVDGAGELTHLRPDHPAAARSCPGDARASSRSSAPGTTSCGRWWWPRTKSTYTLPVALALYATGQNANQLRPAAGRSLCGRRAPPDRVPGLPAQFIAGHRHHRHQVIREEIIMSHLTRRTLLGTAGGLALGAAVPVTARALPQNGERAGTAPSCTAGPGIPGTEATGPGGAADAGASW